MAYPQITVRVDESQRSTAVVIYRKYKQPFLDTVSGACGKELLVRDEDVQVLHHFDTDEDARVYLSSALFTDDVVVALLPLLQAEPDIRIYTTA
ncbi:hypothetical protein IWX75_003482 [Arthrobacter sp. CAN_A6]|uniref:hypothetical protein n=1 Tax=Arthrobacter sp. CAN_A6 TaxID=2787721 RepID=UPI0018CAF28D